MLYEVGEREMKRNQKIKFKQVNDQEIKIFLEYEDLKTGGGFEVKQKEIGQIFSPSGTGSTTINAIQVCGFSEAYDLWGCGLYGKHKFIDSNKNYKNRKYLYDSNGNKIMEQVKDIQLYFDEDTQKCSLDDLDDCDKCFNTPCVCHNKGEKIRIPFNVKRESDIKELKFKKTSYNTDYTKSGEENGM